MKYIKCPDCGTEYLPAEIFYPDDFLGHPTKIEKDIYGKILYYAGKDMCLKESYKCDGCGRKINVEAFIKFNVSTSEFNSNNSTKFKKPALFMEEK